MEDVISKDPDVQQFVEAEITDNQTDRVVLSVKNYSVLDYNVPRLKSGFICEYEGNFAAYDGVS